MVNSCTVCEICCFFGLPLIFQGVGFLTPNWLTGGNCSMQGLFYRCCENGCDTENTYINQTALGLHAASFAIMLLSVISVSMSCCCSSEDDDDTSTNACQCIAICFSLMYPIAGFLNIIGCVLVIIDIPTSFSLGYSFYFALLAGWMMAFQVVSIVCWCMVDEKSSYDERQHIISRSNTSVGRPSETMEGYIAGNGDAHAAKGIAAMVKRKLVIRVFAR